MAVELEIRDGSPYWWNSTDIWIVADPNDTVESIPIASVPCFLKARVRNNGNSESVDATVQFYWANPSIGVSRTTANLVGQSFVTLFPSDVQDVVCLVPWIPVFLNNGHECILAEAFHPSDPITPSPDFNVPTDRHVAQRNLSVLRAMQGRFHFNFEVHNQERNNQSFQVMVEEVPAEKIFEQFRHLVKLHELYSLQQGKLKRVSFTDTNCPDFGVAGDEEMDKNRSYAVGRNQLV